MASTDADEEKARLAEKRAEQWRLSTIDSRASLPFPVRLPLATSMAFVSGMALGIAHGSRTAGLRYRAENAHRLPKTTTGWFLYHKSKNYNVALGGIVEGVKMGAKLSFWTAGAFFIEDMLDQYRGTKDFVNTTLATLSVAGGFSLWNRFPINTTARMAKIALASGLAYGLAQDAIAAAKGRRLKYVDFLTGRGRSKADISADVDQMAS